MRQELGRQQVYEVKPLLPNPALKHHNNTLTHITTTLCISVWAPVLIMTHMEGEI